MILFPRMIQTQTSHYSNNVLNRFLLQVLLKICRTPWTRIETSKRMHEISHESLIFLGWVFWIPSSLFDGSSKRNENAWVLRRQKHNQQPIQQKHQKQHTMEWSKSQVDRPNWALFGGHSGSFSLALLETRRKAALRAVFISSHAGRSQSSVKPFGNFIIDCKKVRWYLLN